MDGDRGGPFVGHAAVARSEGAGGDLAHVVLAVLETRGAVPPTLAPALAYHALRDAAEQGAVRAWTGLDGPGVREVGFVPAADRGPAGEGMSLDLADLRTPAFTTS